MLQYSRIHGRCLLLNQSHSKKDTGIESWQPSKCLWITSLSQLEMCGIMKLFIQRRSQLKKWFYFIGSRRDYIVDLVETTWAIRFVNFQNKCRLVRGRDDLLASAKIAWPHSLPWKLHLIIRSSMSVESSLAWTTDYLPFSILDKDSKAMGVFAGRIYLSFWDQANLANGYESLSPSILNLWMFFGRFTRCRL